MREGNGALVCCYGLAEQKYCEPVHFAGLQQYAAGIAGFLAAYPDITYLVICGGFTDPAVDISEARSFGRLLSSFFPILDISPRLFFEEKSTSTVENLYFGRKVLLHENFLWGDDYLTVFCDNARKKRVSWLASRIFLGYPHEVVSLERRDTNPYSNPIAQELALFRQRKEWAETFKRLENSLCHDD